MPLIPDPKAILRFNDPSRSRSYEEQVEYSYQRLCEALDKHLANLTAVREGMPEGETADVLREVIANLATILGKNVAMRHKVAGTILDRICQKA